MLSSSWGEILPKFLLKKELSGAHGVLCCCRYIFFVILDTDIDTAMLGFIYRETWGGKDGLWGA